LGVESITYPVNLLPVKRSVATNTTAIVAAQADIVILYLNTSSTTMVIEAHAANDTLTVAESGSVHTNLGADGTITLTLPASAAAGVWFTFAVQAAQQLRVDPGTATIREHSGHTPDKYKWADAVGECLTLVSDANGDWATIAKNGTWTEEA